MKRPKSHETGEAAERIFESILPDEWIKQKLHPDYGIDYCVELCEGGELTGLRFEAQVKGTIDSGFLETPQYRIKTSHLDYYMTLRCPVYLVVVHTHSGRGVWVCLQEYARENLKRRNWRKQKTITVKMSHENLLTDTDSLMKSVRKTDRMMAELHPAAIPGAIKAKKERLEAGTKGTGYFKSCGLMCSVVWFCYA